MSRKKKESITRKAFVIAIIAGLLVISDGIITGLLKQSGSFTWVAFVSWTVFFGVSVKERLKAIVGYIIGFLAAFMMIELGNLLSFLNINLFVVIALGAALASALINYFCIELERASKFFPYSASGIFVGMAMTFSGLGIGLSPSNIENIILMLSIILIYGLLGLLSGWATLKFSQSK